MPGRRQRPDQQHVDAHRADARGHGGLEHVAREPRVLADDDLVPARAALEHVGDGAAEAQRRLRRHRLDVRDAADAVGAEELAGVSACARDSLGSRSSPGSCLLLEDLQPETVGFRLHQLDPGRDHDLRPPPCACRLRGRRRRPRRRRASSFSSRTDACGPAHGDLDMRRAQLKGPIARSAPRPARLAAHAFVTHLLDRDLHRHAARRDAYSRRPGPGRAPARRGGRGRRARAARSRPP